MLVLGITVQLAAAAAATQPLDDYINPDRPGLADGSNVVGAGRIQVEMGIQQEYRSSDGNHSRTLFLPTLLRLGLDNSFEFRIESNTYTRMMDTVSTQGAARAEGIAPASVGLKYHFIDSLGWQQPSVVAIVRFFPRSGTRNFKTTRATGVRAEVELSRLSFPTWTPPEFARLSIHDGSKEKIAPVHSDLIAACAAVPDGIRWLTPLSVGRTLRASETAGFANHGLTCLAITS